MLAPGKNHDDSKLLECMIRSQHFHAPITKPHTGLTILKKKKERRRKRGIIITLIFDFSTMNPIYLYEFPKLYLCLDEYLILLRGPS